MTNLPRPVQARIQKKLQAKNQKKDAEVGEREKTKFKSVMADGCGTGHVPEDDINDRLEVNLADPDNGPNNEQVAINRRFRRERYNETANAADLSVHWREWTFLACPTSVVKCLECGNAPFHIGCAVVSIAAETSGSTESKTGQPRSAMGIYYGITNRFNVASQVKDETKTMEMAILEACHTVLLRIIELAETAGRPKRNDRELFPLHTLVIKSDCEYIIKGVTEWIPKWKASNWKTCRGYPVAHQTMWRLIDMWISYLEQTIAVQFWLVTPEENGIARWFAARALRPEYCPGGGGR